RQRYSVLTVPTLLGSSVVLLNCFIPRFDRRMSSFVVFCREFAGCKLTRHPKTPVRSSATQTVLQLWDARNATFRYPPSQVLQNVAFVRVSLLYHSVWPAVRSGSTISA